jgi:hypothetical protein
VAHFDIEAEIQTESEGCVALVAVVGGSAAVGRCEF